MSSMLTLEQTLLDRRSALIIVDVQNDFCHPDGIFGKRGMDLSIADGILEPIRTLIDAAHDTGRPVIFIRNVEDENTDNEAWCLRPDGAEDCPNEGVTRRGTWGAELYHFIPEDRDIVIEKHRFNAFYQTRLETVLRSLGVETLIFTGLATNVCVNTTATQAVISGFHVVIAEDGCSCWSRTAQEAFIENLRRFVGKVADSAAIASLWRRSAGI